MIFGNNTKFLGIYIDQNQDWEIHINELCNELKSMCFSFIIIAEYLGSKALRTVHFVLFILNCALASFSGEEAGNRRMFNSTEDNSTHFFRIQ